MVGRMIELAGSSLLGRGEDSAGVRKIPRGSDSTQSVNGLSGMLLVRQGSCLDDLGGCVPSPDVLLTALAAIANDWRWLAIAWHLVFAGIVAALFAGWRPSARLLGLVLVAPLLSVSVVAWLSGNPFNGTVFAVLAAALVWSVLGLGDTSVTFAPSTWLAAGTAITVFGWTYPHFVRTESWAAYLYASPFGILPCPTLTVVIGVTVMVRHPIALGWYAALIVAGLLYGAIGVFRLGVVLDWVLLLTSALLAAAVARDRLSWTCFPPPLIRILR
jgi:hypothetical protein